MGTIDQPKPTEPKSPVPDVRPLQPGSSDDGRMNSAPATRKNPQTPEIVREEIEPVEVPKHHHHG
jgi:hypothetical protein